MTSLRVQEPISAGPQGTGRLSGGVGECRLAVTGSEAAKAFDRGYRRRPLPRGEMSPCVRPTEIGTKGTRIEIAIILDSLAEGLTPEDIVDHFTALHLDHIRAAQGYAAELAREGLWKVSTG